MANSETLNNDHKSEISRDLKEKMLRNDVYGLLSVDAKELKALVHHQVNDEFQKVQTKTFKQLHELNGQCLNTSNLSMYYDVTTKRCQKCEKCNGDYMCYSLCSIYFINAETEANILFYQKFLTWWLLASIFMLICISTMSLRTLRLRNQIRQMKEDSDLRQAAGIRSMNSKTSLIVYGV